MKRILTRVPIFLLICMLLTTAVFADMGPHPSVSVSVEGLNGRTCYATLLSLSEGTGPYFAVDPETVQEGEGPDGAYSAFAAYRDADGYYFLGEVFNVTGGAFTWGYYPPSTFKLLLWFPDTGEYVEGPVTKTYAFDSDYRVALTENGLGPMEKEYDYAGQIFGFLLRLAVTLAIELGLALLFRYGLLPVLIVNLITQILLNLLLAGVAHEYGTGFGFYFSYFLFEIGIFIVEAIAFALLLPRTNPKHPSAWRAVLYAFLANLLSFGAGLMLYAAFPMAF